MIRLSQLIQAIKETAKDDPNCSSDPSVLFSVFFIQEDRCEFYRDLSIGLHPELPGHVCIFLKEDGPPIPKIILPGDVNSNG